MPKFIDLIGQRFGRLVIKEQFKGGICRAACDCGSEVIRKTRMLKDGTTKSCGCLRALEDITGHRFGAWLVLGPAPRKNGQAYWSVRCDCGNESAVFNGSLKAKTSQSCGCLRDAQLSAERMHFDRPTGEIPEYQIWAGMIQRCMDVKSSSYPRYGGRGISVCERWRGDGAYKRFIADVGPRPSPDHSLDRYPNNDGNYEPGNVRWATRLEQAQNKSDAHLITVGGVTKTLRQWSLDTGIIHTTIIMRLRRGWSAERAVSEAPSLIGRASSPKPARPEIPSIDPRAIRNRERQHFKRPVEDIPEYSVWASMIQRCTNTNKPDYKNYGGRGISVCEQWTGEFGFRTFYHDVGSRPSSDHSLDRYPDKDGDYEPGNVRWATKKEQSENKRNNRFIEANGERLTITEWSRRLGLSGPAIAARIKNGWPATDAVTLPPGTRRRTLTKEQST